ncbi:mannose-P-dolichol utilization defect 1 protein-like protein 2 [Senna tora]|uniref:Mannose-P-dolichol utilization defect 1 protein homolog n=1 Tax=Senna tora TaxID=362788 RepID=A0A834THG2_9FABA|nr:mannose-P-dolichol utilization defect 1 protein-like protein 2 [Senna tora]
MEYLGIDVSCAVGSLRHGNFPDKDCLLPLISKLLGYAIVAASTTVKLPQARPILKILKHRSVRGLSMMSFELEVVGYTIALAYCLHKGLPFSAYGELLFLLIQALILVAIIYYFSQPVGTKTWIRALLYCAVAPTILAGQINPLLFEALYVSSNFYVQLQASQHAVFLFARIPQIWKNFSNKSTGELSFLTCFMNFGGSMGKRVNYFMEFVRVFTSIQESAPTSVIMGSVIGVATNFTILSQIVMYQKPRADKVKKME